MYECTVCHSKLLLPSWLCRTESIVGAGEFGDVYYGVWRSSYGMQEVAIKVLKKNATEEHKVKLLQEAAVMAQFRHPHIVRLLGAVTIREPVRVTPCIMLYSTLGVDWFCCTTVTQSIGHVASYCIL